jgi:hypothetical protein
MKMRLVLETHYTGQFDDSSDMTHVLVDLDPKHRRDMRARLAEVLAMPGIYSVTFFDHVLEPVSIGIDGDVPEWFEEGEEVIAIPDDFSPPAAELQISAPTVRYMPDGIMWCFYEKHGSASYETATISWPFIQTAARDKAKT